jgi:hypothetical protein
MYWGLTPESYWVNVILVHTTHTKTILYIKINQKYFNNQINWCMEQIIYLGMICDIFRFDEHSNSPLSSMYGDWGMLVT